LLLICLTVPNFVDQKRGNVNPTADHKRLKANEKLGIPHVGVASETGQVRVVGPFQWGVPPVRFPWGKRGARRAVNITNHPFSKRGRERKKENRESPSSEVCANVNASGVGGERPESGENEVNRDHLKDHVEKMEELRRLRNFFRVILESSNGLLTKLIRNLKKGGKRGT